MAVIVVVDIFDVEQTAVVSGRYNVSIFEGNGRDEDQRMREIDLLCDLPQKVSANSDNNEYICAEMLPEKVSSLHPHSPPHILIVVALQRQHNFAVMSFNSRKYLHH